MELIALELAGLSRPDRFLPGGDLNSGMPGTPPEPTARRSPCGLDSSADMVTVRRTLRTWA
jgi:hypothetical protein